MTASSVQAGLTASAAEEARLAAVRRYHILDTPPDGAFDRIASLAARLFDAPMATVAIVDTDRVWFKAAHGLDGISETDREPGLCASAILHGEPYVVTDADSDARAFANPLVRSDLGVRFYAAAPITTADGQRLGTVNVLDTRPRQPTDDQLEALKDLAALVMDELELRLSAIRTVAAERERRAEAERLARALQRTLLPPALPDVPGLQVAAAYHTASADEVGGDFYDLFPLDDGRWAFFLGDVCGKGPEAASLTSLTRYTLRAAAHHDPEPAAALATLNAVLHERYTGDGNPRYCTCVFGIVEPAGEHGPAVVRLASGGHPPALVLRSDGSAEYLPTPGGLLVGVLTDAPIGTASAVLNPGDTLVLYTDGLTEARTGPGRDDRYGEDALLAFGAGLAPATPREVVTALTGLLAGFGDGLDDDTALLALGAPLPAIHPATSRLP